MVDNSAWFYDFLQEYLPAKQKAMGGRRDSDLSSIGLGKMDAGKGQEGQGDQFAPKALLK